MQNGYKNPYILIDRDDNLEFTYNSKSMYVIVGDLPKSKLVKVMHWTTSKEIWYNSRSCYEGDNKVKK